MLRFSQKTTPLYLVRTIRTLSCFSMCNGQFAHKLTVAPGGVRVKLLPLFFLPSVDFLSKNFLKS